MNNVFISSFILVFGAYSCLFTHFFSFFQPQLSGGLEKSAAHYVSLLASCVGVWGPQAVPHKNIIMKALSASLRANSKKVNFGKKGTNVFLMKWVK